MISPPVHHHLGLWTLPLLFLGMSSTQSYHFLTCVYVDVTLYLAELNRNQSLSFWNQNHKWCWNQNWNHSLLRVTLKSKLESLILENPGIEIGIVDFGKPWNRNQHYWNRNRNNLQGSFTTLIFHKHSCNIFGSF